MLQSRTGSFSRFISQTKSNCVSIQEAREILGDDAYSFEDLIRRFGASAKLQNNQDILRAPFSSEQLKAIRGYAYLVPRFPSLVRIVRYSKDVLSISGAVISELSTVTEIDRNTYPSFRLVMKGDLSKEEEAIARQEANRVQLREEMASFNTFVSAMLFQKGVRTGFARSVGRATASNLQVVVVVDLSNNIDTKLAHSRAQFPKAIQWSSAMEY